jgi:hypothetical protein
MSHELTERNLKDRVFICKQNLERLKSNMCWLSDVMNIDILVKNNQLRAGFVKEKIQESSLEGSKTSQKPWFEIFENE